MTAVTRADGGSVGGLRGGKRAARVHVLLSHAPLLELCKLLLSAPLEAQRVNKHDLARLIDLRIEQPLRIHGALAQLGAARAEGNARGGRRVEEYRAKHRVGLLAQPRRPL